MQPLWMQHTWHVASICNSWAQSTALCSRMQSSGLAWDSRREGNPLFLNLALFAKHCSRSSSSSSHNQLPIYVTAQPMCLAGGEAAFSPPPHSPLFELCPLSPNFTATIYISVPFAGIINLCPQLRTSLCKNNTSFVTHCWHFAAACQILWSCERAVHLITEVKEIK